MRVSTNPEDEGYKNFDPTKNYQVYLDGAYYNQALMADEEEGCVELVTRDANGKILIDYDKNCLVRTMRYGHVVIVVVDRD